MGSFEKTLAKIMRTPTANDIMANDLQKFLQHYGFELKRSKGSHFIYKHPKCNAISLTIPMHNPVNPTYIDQVRKAILKIEGE